MASEPAGNACANIGGCALFVDAEGHARVMSSTEEGSMDVLWPTKSACRYVNKVANKHDKISWRR